VEYAKSEGIAYREDSTNQDEHPLRNRLRLELIPLLENKYEPALVKTILRSMEIAGSDAEFVALAAQAWLDSRSRTPFSTLHPALQRQCLRIQLEQAGVPLDFALIERLREAPGEIVTAGSDCHISRDEAGVIQRKKVVRVDFNSNEVALTITNHKCESSFGDVMVKCQVEQTNGNQRPRRSLPGTEFFDADKVGTRVTLRHWRPGDRFQPIGMAQEVKLQDLFINQKISRAKRHGLLVAVAADGRIFWVEGLRISEQFKLDNTTSSRLKWQWLRASASN
jgi:tRNA(Ile)-lysidine synthase